MHRQDIVEIYEARGIALFTLSIVCGMQAMIESE